eukprot:SAG11_NODE_1059_length_6002_cov_2.976453_5_plen_80_part_00
MLIMRNANAKDTHNYLTGGMVVSIHCVDGGHFKASEDPFQEITDLMHDDPEQNPFFSWSAATPMTWRNFSPPCTSTSII